MNYRPLSARGKPHPRFDTLHEGIPFWIRSEVAVWFESFLGDQGSAAQTQRLDLLYKRMRLQPLAIEALVTTEAVLVRVVRDPARTELALDLVDYVLRFLPEWGSPADADRLEAILRDGNSVWQVTPVDKAGSFTLTGREAGPLREAVDALAPGAGRAGVHLTSAWGHLAGRDPLPDQAYFQAVKAVEAAAKPVISPDDSQATLGKMIKALDDAPQKFTFILGEPEDVLPVMKALWKTQLRHGTDDHAVATGMTHDEADAAVHLALTLVRWFSGGAFARAS